MPLHQECEDAVGAALLLVNMAPPAVSFVLSLLTHGLSAQDAVKGRTGKEEEDEKAKRETEFNTNLNSTPK